MNSSLQQFITHSTYDAQHQEARPPYPQLKLHIETQIGSVVLMACDQFMQVEFSYRDDRVTKLEVIRNRQAERSTSGIGASPTACGCNNRQTNEGFGSKIAIVAKNNESGEPDA